MNYHEAMNRIRGKGSRGRYATRPGLPGYGVIWRFGYPVITLGHHRTIAYTPTRDDMLATDWTVQGISQ
jgi:hypothetical protein